MDNKIKSLFEKLFFIKNVYSYESNDARAYYIQSMGKFADKLMITPIITVMIAGLDVDNSLFTYTIIISSIFFLTGLNLQHKICEFHDSLSKKASSV